MIFVSRSAVACLPGIVADMLSAVASVFSFSPSPGFSQMFGRQISEQFAGEAESPLSRLDGPGTREAGGGWG